MSIVRLKTILALALSAGLAAGAAGAGPASAGTWSGSAGLAVVGQSTSGSEDSFRTQTDLQDGLTLEDLLLRYRAESGQERFRLDAWGFGAQPSGHLGLQWSPGSPWRLALDYDRRESFFRLTESELGLRADDWSIDRFRGRVDWDGWRAARLGFDLRYVDRSGTVDRPRFALNDLYPLRVDLDETMAEAAFRLETKTTPVHVLFEQAWARYERRDDRRPAAATALEPGNPNLYVDAFDRREEDRDIPTSRLTATWGSDRVEVAGTVLWSPAELDSTGPVSDSFALGGGQLGQVDFVDRLVASADLDTLAGSLRLGFALTPRWSLRLQGDYRDTSTDATLLGERLLRISNPTGTIEIPGSVDESSFFDTTDRSGRLTLEWKDRGWTAWAGASKASRDVAWRRDNDDPGLDVTRDADGYLAGLSWSKNGISGSAEYEHGSFDRFVFRTDPETVDRWTLRFKAGLGNGFSLSAHGRFEQADNPKTESDLDRSSDALGLGLAWGSPDGKKGAGLEVDHVDLSSDVTLVLPGGAPGLSRYDLSLLTTTLHGRTEAGKWRLSASATRLEDSGDTWPLESWIARARVGFALRASTELALFGEYWSYNEDRAQADDYDVTRYGLALGWRFE